MAQWAKLSLVAIQKMIKDEFHPENWMATEASGSASRDQQIQQIQQLLVQFQGVDGTITNQRYWCICFVGLCSHSYQTTRGCCVIFDLDSKIR